MANIVNYLLGTYKRKYVNEKMKEAVIEAPKIADKIQKQINIEGRNDTNRSDLLNAQAIPQKSTTFEEDNQKL